MFSLVLDTLQNYFEQLVSIAQKISMVLDMQCTLILTSRTPAMHEFSEDPSDFGRARHEILGDIADLIIGTGE